MRRLVVVAAALALAPTASAGGFRLTSAAFRNLGPIPKRYTCDGRDVSPPLRWTKPPRAAKSLALEVFDIDAPDTRYGVPSGFVHWLAWGFAPRAGTLAAGARPPDEGVNSFFRLGYGGPCPPRGAHPHHYHFLLFALSVRPRVPASATYRDFYRVALRRHILAMATLVGTYRR